MNAKVSIDSTTHPEHASTLYRPGIDQIISKEYTSTKYGEIFKSPSYFSIPRDWYQLFKATKDYDKELEAAKDWHAKSLHYAKKYAYAKIAQKDIEPKIEVPPLSLFCHIISATWFAIIMLSFFAVSIMFIADPTDAGEPESFDSDGLSLVIMIVAALLINAAFVSMLLYLVIVPLEKIAAEHAIKKHKEKGENLRSITKVYTYTNLDVNQVINLKTSEDKLSKLVTSIGNSTTGYERYNFNQLTDSYDRFARVLVIFSMNKDKNLSPEFRREFNYLLKDSWEKLENDIDDFFCFLTGVNQFHSENSKVYSELEQAMHKDDKQRKINSLEYDIRSQLDM